MGVHWKVKQARANADPQWVAEQLEECVRKARNHFVDINRLEARFDELRERLSDEEWEQVLEINGWSTAEWGDLMA